MTWTGKTFVVGAILTAADMNNLAGDIAAIMNGDTGAPSPVGKVAAWSLLDYQTVSNGADIQFIDIFSSTYEEVHIFGSGIYAVSTSSLQAQISNDSGSTFDSTSDYYWTDGSAYNHFKIGDNKSISNNTLLRTTIHVRFTHMNATTEYPTFETVSGVHWVSGLALGQLNGAVGAKKNTNGPWDSLKIYLSTGNMYGEFAAVGVRKA